MSPRRCLGSNAKGEACGCAPLIGMDYCSAHSNLPDEIRFGSPEQAGKAGASPKPHKPRPREVFDAVAEQYAPHIIARYLEAMSATKTQITGSGDEVLAEQTPDYAIRLRAAVDFLDRWMGKASDKVEMSGPGGGPIQHDGGDLSRLTDEQIAALEAIHVDDPE